VGGRARRPPWIRGAGSGLDARFRERSFAWTATLHRLLDGVAAEALERTLVEADAIRATGFRFVGERP
jgi:hypothetical protein